jgi:hypothetical protein
MSDTSPRPAFVYRLFVNDERTVLVRIWDEGAEIATRESPEHTWGPPVYLTEEKLGR